MNSSFLQKNDQNRDTGVLIILPAYNAAKTLEITIQSIPSVYDSIVLCDDGSNDNTAALSCELGILTLQHTVNKGYGANQKTLLDFTRNGNHRIIVMIHPDNQYDLAAVPEMIKSISENSDDLILGSRMERARENGMPWWKYCGNRLLTFFQNKVYGMSLTEYHSGLRAYSRELVMRMPYHDFSDDFVFDSEVIAWTLAQKYHITEVPTNCYYRADSSSVNFIRSITYGIQTLIVLFKFIFHAYHKKTDTMIHLPKIAK